MNVRHSIAGCALAYCVWVIPAFANTADVGSQVGTASYYSNNRLDMRTATGERYDPEALTAAHASLKLGSWVKVTNLDNGHSVRVRINDRNAPDEDRIIDLSRAAAKAVGILKAGLAQVRIERITAPLHRITMHEPPHFASPRWERPVFLARLVAPKPWRRRMRA